MRLFWISENFVRSFCVWKTYLKKCFKKIHQSYQNWLRKNWITWRDFTPFKSSHQWCSVKKVGKFYRKTPMLESDFNKIAGAQAYNFINVRLKHSCFPVKIPKILTTDILKNIWKKSICLWLILAFPRENMHMQ